MKLIQYHLPTGGEVYVINGKPIIEFFPPKYDLDILKGVVKFTQKYRRFNELDGQVSSKDDFTITR